MSHTSNADRAATDRRVDETGAEIVRKHADTQRPVHTLIAGRWSPVAFDPHRPVDRDALLTLLEAARWAPSCYGDEPWRFVIWDRGSDPQGWAQALACLTEKNQRWARNAPVLVMALADTIFERNGQPNRWAQYDTGAASENLCLQATALGLMAHQMGGFDGPRLCAVAGVPERFTPMAVIALGFQAAPETLGDADLRTRERAGRVRRPLAERFFESRWALPIA